MRNPNGYGSVVKLSGKRRRPYCARKTKEIDVRGFPVYSVIGYYKTREDGLMALAAYNRDPYDIDLSKITMKELYDRWSKRDFPKMPEATRYAHKAAMSHCKLLHDTPYKLIKAYQMQECIDGCGLSYSTQGSIKTLWKHLDLFAMELDIVSKRTSELIHAESIPPSTKKPFSKEEIDLVWKFQNHPLADTVLILIYSGFRINELLNLKIEDVNLEEKWFKGGSKTKAGKDRIVPIHSLIFEMVMNRTKNPEYLIGGSKTTTHQYYKFWNEYMKKLEMNHTPHEARHTFRSLLDSAGANKKCIDLMMGHVSKETGERVYTHKTLEELRTAIQLVTH